MYRASCIVHHASCIMHHASCIMHRVLCMKKKFITPLKEIMYIKTVCPCRSCIQRLHYPAFAAFLDINFQPKLISDATQTKTYLRIKFDYGYDPTCFGCVWVVVKMIHSIKEKYLVVSLFSIQLHASMHQIFLIAEQLYKQARISLCLFACLFVCL